MKTKPKTKPFTFSYAHGRGYTVTVRATDEYEARIKAREEMDRRYEKARLEPPVSWTLRRVHRARVRTTPNEHTAHKS